ncbi:competence type IV pilus minor pilin ComGF [Pontibacillus sp. HMF3514]|uniref:competence type IV pilus minor pilin ComGF n=1 Tax=Pontibacillus sp. HMF3514 TaxID=2692425 RepID=UPI00131FD4EE|nr:competence type IV pilus minor pilin ComGF [Pontibacillus sp. HMF3514]QHE52949.1 hypothetical protein GS400_13340 [Pontibacillus sp. HMF3514]
MIVYIKNLNNDRGITLLEALLSLFITLLILQALPYVLKTVWIYSQQSPQKDVEVYQLYHFIEQDLYTTRSISTISDGVRLYKQNGDQVDIEQYGNMIRRQVNQQGHQGLLHNVKSFEVRSSSKGFSILLQNEGGSIYQKLFNLYTE